MIHSLKSKRTHAEDRIHQIKSRLAEARLELLQLCTGVTQMFSHVGCSWDAGNDASGNAQSGEGGDGSGGGGGWYGQRRDSTRKTDASKKHAGCCGQPATSGK